MKPTRDRIRHCLVTSALVSAGIALWSARRKRAQRATEQLIQVPSERAKQLLDRVAPLLRLPGSPHRAPKVLQDGSGLRCLETDRIYPYLDGILDLLPGQHPKTFAQRSLDTPLTVWAYDRFREALTRAANSPGFPVEVAMIQKTLQAHHGDVVLDLACGQGNFTVEWAKGVGPTGLVVGLDYSWPMLRRAAYHVKRWGLGNVLLIHGDAHHLPFADGSLQKINCSGGFHQFPDLPQALSEISRVSASGAVLTTSTFAQRPDDPRARLKQWMRRRFDLHFVPLVKLGEQLQERGYVDYEWLLPGSGWFGYASARKA